MTVSLITVVTCNLCGRTEQINGYKSADHVPPGWTGLLNMSADKKRQHHHLCPDCTGRVAAQAALSRRVER